MDDIRNIPTAELEQDLKDCQTDVEMCKQALVLNIATHRGTSIQQRIDINNKMIQVIEAELTRRKEEQ